MEDEGEDLEAERRDFVVGAMDRGLRIDQLLTRLLPEFSRTFAARLIDGGKVRRGGREVRRSERVDEGDHIEVECPALQSLGVEPEAIDVRIVHQDADLVIVDKHAGLVVHPNTNDLRGTLVNALLHHITDLSGINGVERPGIVHRIDKDTTGLLVVAKHDRAHHHLGEQFRAHSIERTYHALVWGRPHTEEGTISSILGRHPKERRKMSTRATSGKHAVTHWRVVESYGLISLLSCSLETGRTHQIRVHMSEVLKLPLVGDPVYGGLADGRKPHPADAVRTILGPLRGQMLHATTLGFIHPGLDRWISFQSIPHQPMLGLVSALREAAGIPLHRALPWDSPRTVVEAG